MDIKKLKRVEAIKKRLTKKITDIERYDLLAELKRLLEQLAIKEKTKKVKIVKKVKSKLDNESSDEEPSLEEKPKPLLLEAEKTEKPTKKLLLEAEKPKKKDYNTKVVNGTISVKVPVNVPSVLKKNLVSHMKDLVKSKTKRNISKPKPEVVEPVVEPKKRGRPRKIVVEPVEPVEPKRRGRPPKIESVKQLSNPEPIEVQNTLEKFWIK